MVAITMVLTTYPVSHRIAGSRKAGGLRSGQGGGERGRSGSQQSVRHPGVPVPRGAGPTGARDCCRLVSASSGAMLAHSIYIDSVYHLSLYLSIYLSISLSVSLSVASKVELGHGDVRDADRTASLVHDQQGEALPVHTHRTAQVPHECQSHRSTVHSSKMDR